MSILFSAIVKSCLKGTLIVFEKIIEKMITKKLKFLIWFFKIVLIYKMYFFLTLCQHFDFFVFDLFYLCCIIHLLIYYSIRQSGKYKSKTPPWPPFRPPGKISGAYKDLHRLLHCKTMHAFLFTVLYKVCVVHVSVYITLHTVMYFLSKREKNLNCSLIIDIFTMNFKI